MIKQYEINSLIDSLKYDFETVLFLLDYGRDKESLLITNLICDRVLSFEKRINAGENNLKGVFDSSFWSNKFSLNCTTDELRVKIKELSRNWNEIDSKELEILDYREFVLVLQAWVLKNIDLLKKKSFPESQRKIKKMLFALTGLIMAGILSVVAYNLLTSNYGLKGDFYQGKNFEKHLFSGIKRTINFENPGDMDTRIFHNNFSTRWQGYILIPQDGKYTFFTESDDGNRLYIDDKKIIDAWGEAYHKGEKEIMLSKGSHRITLEYFQDWGESYLRLYWSFNGDSRKIIPASCLRHDQT